MALLTLRSWTSRPWVLLLLSGLLAGTAVLGIGGRLAMAMIQAASNTTPPRFTVGGSLTVVFLGAVNGLVGAGIALAFRWLARRLRIPLVWAHVAFAMSLVLLTARGLRGTAPIGRWYFYPLVAVFGALTLWLERRLLVSAASPATAPARGG